MSRTPPKRIYSEAAPWEMDLQGGVNSEPTPKRKVYSANAILQRARVTSFEDGFCFDKYMVFFIT